MTPLFINEAILTNLLKLGDVKNTYLVQIQELLRNSVPKNEGIITIHRDFHAGVEQFPNRMILQP